MEIWTQFLLVWGCFSGFELGRGLVAERGVFAGVMVVGLDVIIYLDLRVRLNGEAPTLEHFVFEGAHEGLSLGVVARIGAGRHALRDLGFF